MKKAIIIISAILLAIITGLYLLSPISDLDFFWHLATGRWIVDNLRLPSSDPFSYTTPVLLESRELFILKSYWLSQVIYWLLYNLMGYNGIILLRFFIWSLLLYILYKRAIFQVKDSLIPLWLLIVSSMVLLINYPLERPHIWSFLFFNLLLYIFERDKSFYLIPPLMLLWANMHGGYILGSLIIMVYLTGNIINRVLLKRQQALDKELLLWGLGGIIAGFINPCTYHAVTETFTMPESMRRGVIEYLSSIETLLKRNNLTIPVYWLLLLIAITGTLIKVFKKRITPHEIILLAGLGYFSFVQIRFIAFFIIWAIPLVGNTLTEIKKPVRYLLISLLLIPCLYVFFIIKEDYYLIRNLHRFKTQAWLDAYFPESAVQFMKANSMNGNLYNYYDWGGYLIWRFYPEKRVFIDGRQLYKYVYEQSNEINNALEYPRVYDMPAWKAILYTYSVDHILIPPFRLTGDVLPLLNALLNDRDWEPVYVSGSSIIFVKNTEKNAHILSKYAIPKDRALNMLIERVEFLMANMPYSIRFYIALGDLYTVAKDYKKAREIYVAGLRLSPYNILLKERLRLIEYVIKSHQR